MVRMGVARLLEMDEWWQRHLEDRAASRGKIVAMMVGKYQPL